MKGRMPENPQNQERFLDKIYTVRFSPKIFLCVYHNLCKCRNDFCELSKIF